MEQLARLSKNFADTRPTKCNCCDGKISFNKNLCLPCQVFNDATHLIRCHADTVLYDNRPLNERLKNGDCLVCQLVGTTVRKATPYEEWWNGISSSIVTMDCPSTLAKWHDNSFLTSALDQWPDGEHGFRCITRLYVSEAGRSSKKRSIGLQLYLQYKKILKNLTGARQWDAPFLDIPRVTEMLRCCRQEKSLQHLVKEPFFRNFILISTIEQCIITPRFPVEYITLSYEWKKARSGEVVQLTRSNLRQLQQPGSFQLLGLPPLISDAIQLCQELHENYIWIDRFCIVQDDPESKATQIGAMDRIYSSAKFTIVATIDDQQTVGLPGIRQRPRVPSLFTSSRATEELRKRGWDDPLSIIDQSEWNTRGWTFQERLLSPICLFITDVDAIVACHHCGHSSQELIPNQSPFPAKTSLYRKGAYGLQTMTDYINCLQEYTRRVLTLEADILDAFAGVCNILANTIWETSFLYGLPEKYIVQSMLWSACEPGKPRVGSASIPSWSWASLSGPIRYLHLIESRIVDPGPFATVLVTGIIVLIADLHFQDPRRGQLRLLAVAENPEQRDPTRPIELRDYRGRSYRTAVVAKLGPNRVPYRIAQNYPSCLTFTSTVGSLLIRKRPRKYSRHNFDLLVERDKDTVRKIGLAEIPEAYSSQQLGNPSFNDVIRCSVVAICGDWANPFVAADEWHSLKNEVYMCRNDEEVHDWTLYIILLRRTGDVFRRIGIGFVGADMWHLTMPKWQTVVLA